MTANNSYPPYKRNNIIGPCCAPPYFRSFNVETCILCLVILSTKQDSIPELQHCVNAGNCCPGCRMHAFQSLSDNCPSQSRFRCQEKCLWRCLHAASATYMVGDQAGQSFAAVSGLQIWVVIITLPVKVASRTCPKVNLTTRPPEL